MVFIFLKTILQYTANRIYIMSHFPFKEKEELTGLVYVSYDVLDTEEQRRERQQLLERAMVLGNTEKGKFVFTFHTIDGVFCVETTIWSVTEDNVTFKGGVMIPVHSIERIDVV
jgi:hypothetical protein